MMSFELVWTEKGRTGRLSSDDYSWLHERALCLQSRGCHSIRITNMSDLSEYRPDLLPPKWHWEGAVAGADGFNGRAYVANVAMDPQGRLWVFTQVGRFRIHREEFARKLISSEHLAGLPLQLQPSGQ